MISDSVGETTKPVTVTKGIAQAPLRAVHERGSTKEGLPDRILETTLFLLCLQLLQNPASLAVDNCMPPELVGMEGRVWERLDSKPFNAELSQMADLEPDPADM